MLAAQPDLLRKCRAGKRTDDSGCDNKSEYARPDT